MPELSREMIEKFLKDADEKLARLKAEGFNVSSFDKLLRKTKKALKANKTDKLIAGINDINMKMKSINKYFDDLLALINDCQKNFELAKQMGAETKKSQELYSEAKGMFNDEKFMLAVSKVKECKKRLKDSLFIFITEEFKEIYKQMKQLPNNIIKSSKIQKMFYDVDIAIQNNNFEFAWKITLQLKQVKEDISKPILENYREQAKDSIIDFQNRIEYARNLGVDLTDAQEVFTELVQRMRTASEVADFKEVVEYTSAGVHALDRALRRKQRFEGQAKEAQYKLERLILDLDDLKDHCAIPKSMEDLVSQAKSAISNKDFASAVDIAEKCIKKLDKLRVDSKPKVELKFEVSDLQPDLWNRTKISITNKGLASAENVRIKLSGPVEVRRMPVIERLMYNTTKTYEIGLKPEGGGAVPVDIDIQFTRTWDAEIFREHQDFWLDVGGLTQAKPSEPEPTKLKELEAVKAKKTTSEIDCLSCNHPIEKSAPIFKCTCGAIYHLECIPNLDSCLNCDISIKPSAESMSTSSSIDDEVNDVDWEE